MIKSCLVCNKDFYTKPSHVKLGYGKFCSAECQYKNRRSGKVIPCYICNKETYKSKKSLKQSKSKKYFCSKSCQTKWRNTEFVGVKHSNYISGTASYKSILNRHKIAKKCSLCLTVDYRVLAVHHVDENHKNNGLNNLAWLCHNCHFLVHHDKVEKARFLASRN